MAFIGLEVVFPAVFAVIGVGEDFQDENAAGVVVDGGNEALVIAGDIEDSDGLGAADGGEVGMGKDFAHVRDGLPFGSGGYGDPCRKVGGGVGVLLGIVENAAFGDDVHANLLSLWQRQWVPSSRIWMQLDDFVVILARGGTLWDKHSAAAALIGDDGRISRPRRGSACGGTPHASQCVEF